MKKTHLFLLFCLLYIHCDKSTSAEYVFDYTDLSLEDNGNYFFNGGNLSGNYIVDVYINKQLKETAEVYFKNKDSGVVPCLTKETLIKYGFIREKIDSMSYDNEQCLIFNNSGINFNYNSSNQILLLNTSEKLLAISNSGIEDEALWDNGISAFLLNYKVNYNNNSNTNSNNEFFFGQLEPGFNYGAWRLRHLSTWNNNSDGDTFQSAYTYAERGVNSLKSKLIIGDKQTSSDIFDSISFRGVSLSKDESMIPYSIKKYTPKITGVARSQAVVEVRQDGYLLYSTSVPPGEFEISSSRFANIGNGFLDVTVIEADGQKKNYSVAYSIPVVSLPEGYYKYSITTGNYRSVSSNGDNPFFMEGTYSYGLPLGITLYGGVQWADIYNSYAIGISKDTGNFGAVSLDGKISRSKNNTSDSMRNGYAYGLRYNKNIGLTNTDISMASQYFYSKDYKNFLDAVEYSDFHGFYNKKSSTNASISQPLGDYGSIILSYNYDKYWNAKDRTSITTRYAKSIKDLSLSLSYTKNEIVSKRKNDSEDLFNIMLSMPLSGLSKSDIYTNYQLTSSTESSATHDFGVSGLGFDRRLSWNVREQVKDSSDNKVYSYINASWRGTYGEVGANYSHSNSRRMIGMNSSGGVVIHEEGITLGQTIPHTAALVSAKGVHGATVIGYPGIKTDHNGYTISSSLSPYMSNLVSIDPSSLPSGSEIRQTDIRVVPTEGAIVKAQYKTSIGMNTLMKIMTPQGTPLAFGSIISVKDKNNVTQSTSIVGENGEAYISGLDDTTSVTASWGRNKSENCIVDFLLPKKEELSQPVIFLKGVCK
ncbi:fimbria/pilus outer membrane usher protein [Salmonella enterica]|nr:fimbria/pilus outer membrane usher protein [Salmonella enterica subsp. enterica serovar Bovismorbificans]EHJ9882093.1 fimbria/pilus outer membrane usher protein [Salmonella enterica subsp. enterica serovar Adelaide]EHJ9903754.1 fimbria/pilus outer membrane usher protein [Salmonella enterica subsp. enterica serovar Adelaide]EHL6684807.1 fimbria/pilus outer membrane usher protein [Salmonella enterica]